MQPRIEFPGSLLNGRPAPPPITLDELQALPAYNKFGLEARYTASGREFEFFGGRGYNITVTKKRIIYGSLKINMRFVEPNWDSLLLNIYLYFTAQKSGINFNLAENAYFLKNPANIKSINFLSELVKFDLVSEEDFLNMRNKVFLSKPISTLIRDLNYISVENKEKLVQIIFKKFGFLKEEEKYRVAVYLAYTAGDSMIFQEFLKIYGNGIYEKIPGLLKKVRGSFISEKYFIQNWNTKISIFIKNENDLIIFKKILELSKLGSNGFLLIFYEATELKEDWFIKILMNPIDNIL